MPLASNVDNHDIVLVRVAVRSLRLQVEMLLRPNVDGALDLVRGGGNATFDVVHPALERVLHSCLDPVFSTRQSSSDRGDRRLVVVFVRDNDQLRRSGCLKRGVGDNQTDRLSVEVDSAISEDCAGRSEGVGVVGARDIRCRDEVHYTRGLECSRGIHTDDGSASPSGGDIRRMQRAFARRNITSVLRGTVRLPPSLEFLDRLVLHVTLNPLEVVGTALQWPRVRVGGGWLDGAGSQGGEELEEEGGHELGSVLGVFPDGADLAAKNLQCSSNSRGLRDIFADKEGCSGFCEHSVATRSISSDGTKREGRTLDNGTVHVSVEGRVDVSVREQRAHCRAVRGKESGIADVDGDQGEEGGARGSAG
mmetsp:Transcript_7489/g.17140  ORF Transcript_7489/g.17140 Transcript_7489/m.17140 type:complete len:364 (+) Transcript_7489:1879-2970(+)